MQVEAENIMDTKLVDAEGLRLRLWDASCRPGIRTIRRWTAEGKLPHLRVGGSIFFDVEQVRAAISRQ